MRSVAGAACSRCADVRVGVDATSWANRRGYGRFARNVVGRLVAGEDEYVLFTDERTAREEELPEGALIRAVAVGRPPAADAPRSLRDLGRVAQAASRERVDVFLFPSLYTWFPVRGTPTVVGIHDVIAEQYPELTLPDSGARARWRLKRWLAVKRATKIFTVSQASRKLLVRSRCFRSVAGSSSPKRPIPSSGRGPPKTSIESWDRSVSARVSAFSSTRAALARTRAWRRCWTATRC